MQLCTSRIVNFATFQYSDDMYMPMYMHMYECTHHNDFVNDYDLLPEGGYEFT